MNDMNPTDSQSSIVNSQSQCDPCRPFKEGDLVRMREVNGSPPCDRNHCVFLKEGEIGELGKKTKATTLKCFSPPGSIKSSIQPTSSLSPRQKRMETVSFCIVQLASMIAAMKFITAHTGKQRLFAPSPINSSQKRKQKKKSPYSAPCTSNQPKKTNPTPQPMRPQKRMGSSRL